MNKVILFGRLTAEPELKYTTSGKAVMSFTLAVNGYSKDADADFINCVAWSQQAEYIANYQHKGNRLLVAGRLQVRKYETADGSKRYVTEVICENVTGIEHADNNTATASATAEDDPFGQE